MFGINRFFITFNKLYFKYKGIEYGKNLNVLQHIYLRVSSNAYCKIGDHFLFTSGNSFNPLCRNIKGCICIENNAKLLIGDNVGLSSACVWVHSFIQIGNNVKIGGDTILLDSDSHSTNYLQRRNSSTDLKNTTSSPIIIENDVLIGARCIILKGVTIGEKSIVGAGSVVTKSIPPNEIWAGNPAKFIKQISNTKCE